MTEASSCDEKDRLLDEYQKATTLYSQFVRDLVKSVGLLEVEFEFVSRTTIRARQAAQTARERFYKHLEEHGC